VRRQFWKSVAAITCLLALSSAATAMIAWAPLEDRAAESDLIVIGEIVGIGQAGVVKGAPDLTPCTIKVTRVLKGDAGTREVRMLWRKPPEAKPGRPLIVSNPAPIVYRVGQKEIWMLKKHPVVADVYTEGHPYLREPVDKADLVVAVVGAMRNPEATLKDAKAKRRLRFSAAYSLLRDAVPESKLPVTSKRAIVEGKKETKKVVPDTSGHELLPAETVNLAVPAVIDYFTTDELYMQNVAYTVLYKIGIPLGELMPPQERVRGQTGEQARRAAAERRKITAEAIRKWWAANSGKLKLYVPKKVAAARRHEPTKPKGD